MMSLRTLVCTLLLVILFISLDNQCQRCHSYLMTHRTRNRGSYLHSDSGSDFMGDIARDRVTIKSLAKLSAASPEEKSKLDQFSPPKNFERDELLRNLAEINSLNVSWFQLTLFAQKRYAKSVMCVLDSPSSLDLVSGSSSSSYSGSFSLGSAADGLWRVTLSNEEIYKSWAKGIQIFYNIRGADGRDSKGTFEQIIQLPLPASGFVPSRIRQAGPITRSRTDGAIEYSFQSTFVTWIGREWRFPSFGASDSEDPSPSPFGSLGASYMDGKVWLDVRDLVGRVTTDSAKASKFTALTYISSPKGEKDWTP